MKLAKLLAVSLMASTLAVTAQAATLTIETLPSGVSLMANGLKKEDSTPLNEVSSEKGHSQKLDSKTNIVISPVFTSKDRNRPDIFGMLTIIVDPKIPMTSVSCSGFSKTNILYAVKIQLANQSLSCNPNFPKENTSVEEKNVESDITIHFVNTTP